MTEKNALREELRARRAAISVIERVELSARICERVITLPEYRAAGTVLCYASFGGEVDTWALIREIQRSGRRLALPVIREDRMFAALYRDGDLMQKGVWGILEPESGTEIAPGEIDLVVAPGLGFDRAGNRIGFGGGYFDGFLKESPAFRAGLCFQGQLLDNVPAEAHDQPMDAVITESGIYRRGGKL